MPRRATCNSGGEQPAKASRPLARERDRLDVEALQEQLARDSVRAAARDTLIEGLAHGPPTGDRDSVAVLLRLDARGAGQLHALPSGGHRIGRCWDAEVRIDEQTVSRVHARLERDDLGYRLVDCESANGTYVNDTRVDQRRLSSGDILQLGNGVRFKFSLVSRDEYRALNVLHERGHLDPLTRVHNRRYLTQHLLSEIAFAQRHRTDLSVVLIDIDHFKRVNDEHGHSHGDRVLQTVAQILSDQVRTEDTVARYGGEEFMLVLRGTPVVGACALAERIRQAIGRTAFDEAEQMHVSISAGCASLQCAAEAGIGELIDLADRRLYQAKRLGRDRVVGTGRSLVSLPPPAGESEANAVTIEPGEESCPASRVASQEDAAARMANAFDSLDERLRLVVGLFYQEGCSVAEISQITGESILDTAEMLAEGERRVRLQAGVLGAA